MNIKKIYTLRRDIVAVLKKYPNISAEEVAKHFQIKATLNEITMALNRGVTYGIFQKTGGPNLTLYSICNIYTTRLIGYLGPKNLKKTRSDECGSKNNKRRTSRVIHPRRIQRKRAREIGKIGRHQVNTEKALVDTGRASYIISNANTKRNFTSEERSRYIADLNKLQKDLSDLRKSRDDFGLDGVDRGALK